MQRLLLLSRLLACVLLGGVFVGRLHAQEASPSHREAARQLLELMDMQKMLDESIDVMLHMQIEQNPSWSPYEDIMRSFMGKYLNMDYLRAGYLRIYTDLFTEQEIREMISFYQTDTGRKAAQLAPVLLSRGGALGQEVLGEHMHELEQLIIQRAAILEAAKESGPDAEHDAYDTYMLPDDASLTSFLESQWDWAEAENSCVDNPHTFSFTEDETFMTLSYRKPREMAGGEETAQVRYEILHQGLNYIRAQMEGEVRTTEEGEPVVWDLVLMGGDEYCWRQMGWEPDMCTPRVVRCQ